MVRWGRKAESPWLLPPVKSGFTICCHIYLSTGQFVESCWQFKGALFGRTCTAVSASLSWTAKRCWESRVLCVTFRGQCKFYSNAPPYVRILCLSVFRLSSYESLMPSIICFPVYTMKRCLSPRHVPLSSRLAASALLFPSLRHISMAPVPGATRPAAMLSCH